MSEGKIYASGGFCAPLADAYNLHPVYDDIWPNHIAPKWRNRTFKGRLKNFFAWSPDWGTKMRGGPMPQFKISDYLEPLRAERGGISFFIPPKEDA